MLVYFLAAIEVLILIIVFKFNTVLRKGAGLVFDSLVPVV